MGSPHIGSVGGSKRKVTVEFTRPANTTAYTAGDLVIDSATAPTLMDFASLAREAGSGGYIVGARLTTDKKSITPQFRVHLFNASDATLAHTTVGDNAPLKQLYADEAKYCGSFDLPAMTTPANSTNSDLSRTQDDGALRKPFLCAAGSRSIYAALEAIDAFTPASGQKFTLTLEAEQD